MLTVYVDGHWRGEYASDHRFFGRMRLLVMYARIRGYAAGCRPAEVGDFRYAPDEPVSYIEVVYDHY